MFNRRFGYESHVWSSDLALIVPALAINRVISKDGQFDIRVMGVVSAAVFLLALWLLVSAGGGYWALGLAVIFIFCDAVYTTYFNSFYMDAGALLFLLLGCAAYVRRMPVLLLACAMLLAASKTQYAVMGLWLAVLFWWIGRRWMAGAVLATALVTFGFSSPPDYAAKNAFNVIFTRLVPDSKDPDRTLAELGLDGSYRQWIGQNAYAPDSRLEDPAFYVPFMRTNPPIRGLGSITCGIHGAPWRVLRLGDARGCPVAVAAGGEFRCEFLVSLRRASRTRRLLCGAASERRLGVIPGLMECAGRTRFCGTLRGDRRAAVDGAEEFTRGHDCGRSRCLSEWP